MNTEIAFQKCINPDCAAEFDCRQAMFKCPKCGELLDIKYNWDKVELPNKLSDISKRWATRNNKLDFSGVWRFRNLLNFCDDKYKVTVGEGQTILQQNDHVAKYVDMQKNCLHLQYEGLNPSGSFKDNGMSAALSHATMVGAKSCACTRPEILPHRSPSMPIIAALSALYSSVQAESLSENLARLWITAHRPSRFSAISMTA